MYNQNSRHLILEIYRLHHPKTNSKTSLLAPMPQEQCSLDLALYSPCMNGFLKNHTQAELSGRQVSSKLQQVHNQKPQLDHWHLKEDWMVLCSYKRHLQHVVQQHLVQCLPHICKWKTLLCHDKSQSQPKFDNETIM